MSEKIDPLAGKPVPPSKLTNVPRLMTAYYSNKPDPKIASQRVAFGTSGHRGGAFTNSFNETHIRAISQAVCLYRKKAGTDGPLFLGRIGEQVHDRVEGHDGRDARRGRRKGQARGGHRGNQGEVSAGRAAARGQLRGIDSAQGGQPRELLNRLPHVGEAVVDAGGLLTDQPVPG